MSVVELRSRSVDPQLAEAPITEAQIAAFRGAMRHLAGAVAVITTGTGEARTGFTATSVSSFSMEPPALLVCLNRESSSWPIVREHGGFCVNLLAHDQSHVADRFAGRGGAKGVARYEGAHWQEQPSGALGLADALVSIDCRLDEAIERHSHAILIGRVNSVTLRTEAEPLLYWHGAYRLLSGLDRVLTQA
ncbi:MULTISPECIES: flavin reductase family protein [unclassified Devosia]|jgi:flavin reductase (DIM6/NTAB) family NADH-FMN oxidoreductase RutF|uniref:flavin reductase family protein n=1 Tax=unclassified Devosia TaxID=196773 RepID=UPI000AE6D1B2|nr:MULTISPECIES: flavin reductase family protein [unclassified Devosia]MBN9364791.1 flavin reductase family protein [Devosia sp.]